MCGRIIQPLHFNIRAAHLKRLHRVCSCRSVSEAFSRFGLQPILFTKFLPFHKPNPVFTRFTFI